jgi:hypothetical protein
MNLKKNFLGVMNNTDAFPLRNVSQEGKHALFVITSRVTFTAKQLRKGTVEVGIRQPDRGNDGRAE